MRKTKPSNRESSSQLVDAKIRQSGDGRGKMFSRVRILANEACPEVAEQWKWQGVPVWSHQGMICTGETYKDKVELRLRGALLLTTRMACLTPAWTAR